MDPELSLYDVWFQSRWVKATPAERRFLVALVELGDGEPVLATDLAAYLGKPSPDSISSTRRGLVRKGWIRAPRGPYRGRVALTDPRVRTLLARHGD